MTTETQNTPLECGKCETERGVVRLWQLRKEKGVFPDAEEPMRVRRCVACMFRDMADGGIYFTLRDNDAEQLEREGEARGIGSGC